MQSRSSLEVIKSIQDLWITDQIPSDAAMIAISWEIKFGEGLNILEKIRSLYNKDGDND